MKFNEILIKNDLFRTEITPYFTPERVEENKHEEGSLLNRLRSKRRDIIEKKHGVISAFNFNKQVFHSGNWSELSKIARGLFIKTATGEIEARGYEKFFNYKEDKFNSDNFLRENLAFPVEVYEKYNGFLGILSVFNDNLLFHSKSSIDGDYPEYFMKIFSKTQNVEDPNDPYETKFNELKKFMKDNNICLVFEVIDHINDPHIVKYNADDIVLLDAVYLEEKFRNMPYDELVEIGKRFNFKVKEKKFVFNNFNELHAFIVKEELDMTPQKEGYVIVDRNNYHFKLKCKWYKTWKFMRSIKDKIGKRQQFSTSALTMPVMNEFVAWCKKQNEDYLLNNDIITLRDKFYDEKY